MTVTRAGNELVSLKPEMFSDVEQLFKLAKRTGGKLGMHRKELYDSLNEVCIKTEVTLEWIPSKSDPNVGYIKMRPVSTEAIMLLDELRSSHYVRRYKLSTEQAIRLFKVTKRNLIMKRNKVLDFAVANCTREDRPLDKEIFRVWVEDMTIKQKSPRLSNEEKDAIFENLAAIRRALKKQRPVRKAPAASEVNIVIENTVTDKPEMGSMYSEEIVDDQVVSDDLEAVECTDFDDLPVGDSEDAAALETASVEQERGETTTHVHCDESAYQPSTTSSSSSSND